MKQNIENPANEALWCITDKSRNTQESWYAPEVRKVVGQKKEAYLRSITYNPIDEQNKYNHIINDKILKIQKNYWEQFTSDMDMVHIKKFEECLDVKNNMSKSKRSQERNVQSSYSYTLITLNKK